VVAKIMAVEVEVDTTVVVLTAIAEIVVVVV
jgi:hypothetical protein